MHNEDGNTISIFEIQDDNQTDVSRSKTEDMESRPKNKKKGESSVMVIQGNNVICSMFFAHDVYSSAVKWKEISVAFLLAKEEEVPKLEV